MLRIPEQEEVKKIYRSIAYNDHYKHFNRNCYWDLEPRENDGWNRTMFISVDSEENIVGIFSALFTRPENYVNNIAVAYLGVKSYKSFSVLFLKDFRNFILTLFYDLGAPKICFTTTSKKNRALYKKFVEKAGGREVGVFEEHVMLADKKLYDEYVFEIMKKDFRFV